MENKNICCFIGHRKVENKEKTEKKVYEIAEKLIIENKDIFLFGSRSEFNDLCYKKITELKSKYKNIKRIYVRAEYPYIDESYKNFLLEKYEKTYYSQKLLNSGKLSYIKRNYEMIDKSSICIFYYNRKLNKYKGTEDAFSYAKRKNKKVINIFDLI